MWARLDPLARQGMVEELNAMGVYPAWGSVDIFDGKAPTWTNNLFNAGSAGGDNALTIGINNTKPRAAGLVRWVPILAIAGAVLAAYLIARRASK